jgi:hypothetical protein
MRERRLTKGLGWMFKRPEPKVTFGRLVRALLADAPKKNSWGRADRLHLHVVPRHTGDG